MQKEASRRKAERTDAVAILRHEVIEGSEGALHFPQKRDAGDESFLSFLLSG